MSDTCNCCLDSTSQTPLTVYNRPGLNALAYRVGVHEDFKESLLAALTLSRQPALQSLTSRIEKDFTVALLDSWSVVSDILTFYQERIANESYLRTATERLSVLELARLIDYELRPGVAASTYLSFKLDDLPGALTAGVITGSAGVDLPPVLIESGTKVQSVPGPNEMPQTFETIADIYARAEWNALKPRLTQKQVPTAESKCIVFNGLNNDLKVGDVLFINSPKKSGLRKILSIYLDLASQTTRVDFNTVSAFQKYQEPQVIADGSLNDFTDNIALNEDVIREILKKTWKSEDLSALLKTHGWATSEFVHGVKEVLEAEVANNDSSVHVFRKHVSVFGYNAAKQVVYDGNNRPKKQSKWKEWHNKEQQDRIYLDNTYDALLPNSFVSVQSPDQNIENMNAWQVSDVHQLSRTAYGISSKTTLVQFPFMVNWFVPNLDKDIAALRNLTVYIQSEKLELAPSPIDEFVTGPSLELGSLDMKLNMGQAVLFTGKQAAVPGITSSELLVIKDIIVKNGLTLLIFEKSISSVYVRSSVYLNANVANSTNGETVQEILGSGDTSKPFQKFTLKQTPLTFIGSSTASGATSTLELRVNNVLWLKTESFINCKPGDKVYVTQLNDDTTTTVIFGDGINGSRLPRGQNNIRAKYRKGIGLSGLVKANQLSQLITRPLGVKEVTNMLAPSGAADAEVIDDARANATLNIHTLDRVVSLQDYEDFARAYAGIDKALATWAWFGQKRMICVTVAGSNGQLVNTELNNMLTDALINAGDTNAPVAVCSYKPVFFRLEAKLQIDPAYIAQTVISGVDACLRDKFSFKQRQLGQLVSQSEVIAAMQNVDGVIAVDLDNLYRTEDAGTGLNNMLASARPKQGDEKIISAELLIIDPRPIHLTQML
jgi:hypothetical protein